MLVLGFGHLRAGFFLSPTGSHPAASMVQPAASFLRTATKGHLGHKGSGRPAVFHQASPSPSGEVGPGQNGLSRPWANFEGAGMSCSAREKVKGVYFSIDVNARASKGPYGMFGL